MLLFCQEIENDNKRKALYHKKISQLADWYTNSVQHYSGMLKMELGLSKMEQNLQNANINKDILEDLTEDLSYNFSAKLAYFCVSDALVKLILSKYSFGPTEDFLRQHQLTF